MMLMNLYTNDSNILGTIVNPSPIPVIGDNIILGGRTYRVMDRKIIYITCNGGMEVELIVEEQK